MRFGHIADCHVGSYRDSKMKDINILSFIKAIDMIIEENALKKIDFVIIAGDLFNTAVPSIEALKVVFEKLKELQENQIKVYGIAGSHDYSVAGKSMLEVLEKAKLFTNLMKGKINNKKLCLDFVCNDNVCLTGIVGRKGTIEKEFYNSLDYEILESKKGDKIFVFHSAITEFVPEELSNMNSTPLAMLPKNFHYYAGGHVHYRFIKETLGGTICFPGPTCPNNFKEWMDLKKGSFVICELNEGKVKVEQKFIEIKKIKSIVIECQNLMPNELEEEIKRNLIDVEDKIILLKIFGKLHSGSISDINFEDIINLSIKKGAYSILRNTSKLNIPEMDLDEMEVKDIDVIEQEFVSNLIKESKLKDKNLEDISIDFQKEFISKLIDTLSLEKEEGETNSDFDERINEEFKGLINGLN